MIDIRQHSEIAPAPNVQEWRNLYFTRDGRTVWGVTSHDTEADCILTSVRFFSEWMAYYADGGRDPVEMYNSEFVPFEVVGFAVPMPWRIA